MYKILNLSLKEFRIAKNRNICGYKGKDKLLRIINNNKGDRKSLLKSKKKKKPKKDLISQQEIVFLN